MLTWVHDHWRPIAVVWALGIAFAFGRFTAIGPEEHERVESDWHSAKQEWTAKTFERVTDTKVVRVVDRTFRPDGTLAAEHVDERAATHTEEHAAENSGARTESEGTRVATRDVVPHLPDWRVSALVGAELSLDPVSAVGVVGGAVDRRIAGPFSAGAWALYTPARHGLAVGLSLSVQF